MRSVFILLILCLHRTTSVESFGFLKSLILGGGHHDNPERSEHHEKLVLFEIEEPPIENEGTQTVMVKNLF